MKTRMLILGAFVILAMALQGQAQTSASGKYQEIKIKTSAQCGMCKDRIEKDLAYEKGVVSSTLNLEDKYVTIQYSPKKTNADKLRLALSKMGYDADDVAADKEAYDALPACCKKKESSGCKPGCKH